MHPFFEGLFPFLWIGMLVLFVGAIVFSIYAERRRKKLWGRWSTARNWVYRNRWPEMVGAYSNGPFGRGSSRRVSHAYEGTFDGLAALGFAYQYSTGSGKNRSTHHYHVCRVLVPGARFPHLSISQQVPGQQLFGADTQFEDAEFNRRWWVKGSHPRFTHDVFHPRAMELFQRRLPDFDEVWFEGGAVLASIKGSIQPPEVDGYLRLLTDVVRTLPPFLLRELGATPPQLTREGPGVSHEEQQRRIAQLAAEEEAKD